jgi:hypothetical protein
VAFRHYNSNDMYYLLLDDVTLTDPDAVVYRWTTPADVTNPYVLKGLSPSTKYEVEVQPVYEDGSTGDWTRTLVFWTLEGDTETDVNRYITVNINDDEQNARNIYDIQGRKVENLSKGIYIINGKKVVVK